MKAPTIQINDLTLRFGSAAPLFERLNLDIVAGRTTCILGPSGCGKSTLLRLLSGAAEFDSDGEVEFDPVESSMVAWMGQNDLLLPWLSLIALLPLLPGLYAYLGAIRYRHEIGQQPKFMAANVVTTLLTSFLIALLLVVDLI